MKLDLDLQYSPTKWVTRLAPSEVIQNHINFCTIRQEKIEKEYPCELKVKYNEEDSIDVFYASIGQKEKFTENKEEFKGTVVVFLHGGYWSKNVLEDVGAYGAPAFVKDEGSEQVIYVTIDYRLSPPNKIGKVFESSKQGIKFICSKFPSSKVCLVGHSAGAHLSAMYLSQPNISPQVKSAALISGVYSLKEIQQCCINEESNLFLTDEEVKDYSPSNLVQSFNTSIKVSILVAKQDSSEFLRQSKEYFNALETQKVQTTFNIIPETDHFNVVENLANSESVTNKVVKELISQH